MANTCIIVGAGFAGLMAAAKLQGSGINCRLLEANDQVGGRMIAWQHDDELRRRATFDLGAQFFTVREARFAQFVSSWIDENIVVEWSRGFATADGSFYADGHPRYRGRPHMGAVAQYLATELDIRLNTPIKIIEMTPAGWQVTADNGDRYQSQALMLTPPIPEALALLEAGDVHLPAEAAKVLTGISYEPCLALCVQLAGNGKVPDPGGMWPIGEPIAWIADNFQKGVSAVPGAITIHAGSEFSRQHWQASDSEVAEQLLAAAEEWLVDRVEYLYVHRWRYSKPLWLHPEPVLNLLDPGPIVFAGDAFAGPRVEGAALSGLAAADWLLEYFGENDI
jgi:predicted NAD/FAD-dependent oxidoreductase